MFFVQLSKNIAKIVGFGQILQNYVLNLHFKYKFHLVFI